jgi:predicted chitinase
MAKYIDSLNSEQLKNLAIITDEIKKYFTNPVTVAGILAIVAKESNFKTKPEISYSGTSNQRIRAIFGSRVSSLSDSQLDQLKKNDIAFFERVYGAASGQPLGNTLPGDGFKYRGRGFNGLTGRANYKFYGDKIGVNLQDNPDLLNDAVIAAKALVMYFRMQAQSKVNKINQYNANNAEDFKNVRDSTAAFYHANAGWGKSKEALVKDTTGGYKKSQALAPEFLEYLGEKKKPIKWIFIVIVALVLIWYFIFRK